MRGRCGGIHLRDWGRLVLTDKECKAAKPGDKPVKLFDGHGLHLLVSTTGHKSWRLKYRVRGKEKQFSLGPYPEVRISQAREMCMKARAILRDGRDPALEFNTKIQRRKITASHESKFASVAEAWHSRQVPRWKERHADDVIHSLRRDVFPIIGEMDVRLIRAGDIRDLLLDVQERGALETAHRLLQRISSVFQYAIAFELTEFDPTAGVSLVLQKVIKRKQPAALSIDQARDFLRAFERIPAHPSTKLASRLLALTAARPGMVQMAQPGEFKDLNGPSPHWRVPAAKMKLRKVDSQSDAFDFVIPLSRQAVETVKAAMELAGACKYLFPSARHSHRPITSNALNIAYRRVLGWEGKHVPHGWRASFSTIMNERALDLDRPGDRAVIDLMLAHVPSGVESRYNRAAYMARRRQLAQEWADMLLKGFSSPEHFMDLPRR